MSSLPLIIIHFFYSAVANLINGSTAQWPHFDLQQVKTLTRVLLWQSPRSVTWFLTVKIGCFFFFSFFLKCAPQQMMGSVKQRSPVENLKTQPELKWLRLSLLSLQSETRTAESMAVKKAVDDRDLRGALCVFRWWMLYFSAVMKECVHHGRSILFRGNRTACVLRARGGRWMVVV